MKSFVSFKKKGDDVHGVEVKEKRGYIRCIIAFMLAAVAGFFTAYAVCEYCIQVDIGHGYKISKHEYRMFERSYEDDIKDTAYQMVAVEKAMKDMGITLTEDEMAEGLEEYKNMNWLAGEEYNEDKAYIDTKVALLSDKAIAKFKEESVIPDSLVEETVASQHNHSQVAGNYKVIDADQLSSIMNTGVSFDDIDNMTKVIESGHSDGMAVDNATEAKVGGLASYQVGDGTAKVVKVDNIINDSPEIREIVKEDLKETDAQEQFFTFINETLGRTDTED